MKFPMKKIILIEDDNVDQLAFKRFAETTEFTFTYDIASSISEAKEMLAVNDYEAIVSDYFLGDGTAFDILKDLTKIPLIITTGTGDEEIAVKAMKMGAYDYLIKDVDGHYLTILNITIENAIRHFNSEVELKAHHENLELLVAERTAELKKEIEERKQNEISLRESELKYRFLADYTYDFEYWINPDGNYKFVSKSCERISGYAYHEFLEDSNLMVKIIRSDFKEKVQQHYGNVARDEEHKFSMEFPIIAKNGSEVWLEHNSFPVFDDHGNFAGRRGNNRDITDKKKMLDEIIESRKRAENADKMKSIFLGQMSHEIRTPINAITSMTSLIKSDFELDADDDLKGSFEIIERAGNRIIRTVDLLINLSEIQAGTYEIVPTRVNILGDILGIIVAENKKLARKKNIELLLTSSTNDTETISDAYTVNQIFIQLIENAVKYTEKGSVKISLSKNETGNLVVEIKDTGIGISEDFLPQIFEPFKQEEMGYTRKFEGNGIGLALVKTYGELNNAKIEVESKKGVGSTFRVIFK